MIKEVIYVTICLYFSTIISASPPSSYALILYLCLKYVCFLQTFQSYRMSVNAKHVAMEDSSKEPLGNLKVNSSTSACGSVQNAAVESEREKPSVDELLDQEDEIVYDVSALHISLFSLVLILNICCFVPALPDLCIPTRYAIKGFLNNSTTIQVSMPACTNFTETPCNSILSFKVILSGKFIYVNKHFSAECRLCHWNSGLITYYLMYQSYRCNVYIMQYCLYCGLKYLANANTTISHVLRFSFFECCLFNVTCFTYHLQRQLNLNIIECRLGDDPLVLNHISAVFVFQFIESRLHYCCLKIDIDPNYEFNNLHHVSKYHVPECRRCNLHNIINSRFKMRYNYVYISIFFPFMLCLHNEYIKKFCSSYLDLSRISQRFKSPICRLWPRRLIKNP